MLRQSTLFLFSAAFLSKCNGFTANSAATGNHQSTLKLSSTGSDYEELLLGQTSDRRTSSLTAASAILPNIASAEVPVARTALQTAASLTLPPMGLGEFLLSSPA